MSILTLIDGKTPQELGDFFKNSLDEFVKEKIQATINQLLQGEIEDFLTEALRDQTFDIRNGFYKRHLKTSYGSIEVSVPRDRLNLFETKLIQPYKQTTADLEYMVQTLYLRGMTHREIVSYLDETIGLSMSKQSTGKMVRKILSTALEFKERKLPKCVAIFMDGTYVPLKRKYSSDYSSEVNEECVMVIMGITDKGHKEILDFITVPNEGSHSWKDFLMSLKERGIGNPKLFITDGLQGMPNAIKEVFPKAKHQRCLVHIQRNISQNVRVKDRTEITSDFKKVYNQETVDETNSKFKEFVDKWKITYPRLINRIVETPGLFTYLEFPKQMWKYIMTSNAIESFNAELKRYSNRRILFNSESNSIIVLTGCISDYNQSVKNKKEKYLSELTEEEKYNLGFDLLAD